MKDAYSQRTAVLCQRHLRIGWVMLAGFATVGLTLDALHGFKLDLYLAPANETRRLMWTLAHAHGALLGLVHLAFAALLRTASTWKTRARELASTSLTAGAALMPTGFLLGGAVTHGGDPGVGTVLVPIGGLLLVLGLVTALRGAWRAMPAAPPPPS